MTYSPLHVHSEYTLTDGSMSLRGYLDRLDDLGLGSGAITETHNLFSAFKFHQMAMNRGVKPVIGVDLRIRMESDPPGDHTGRIRVLVEHRDGYRTLCQLISKSYRNRTANGLSVPLGELVKHPEGLFVLGPHRPGPEYSPAVPDTSRLNENIALYKQEFGERFYVEVPLYGPLEERGKEYLSIARNHDVQAVYTQPAYFPTEDDFDVLKLRVAVQSNTKLEELDSFSSHRYKQFLGGEQQIRDWVGQQLEPLENTSDLAEQCYFEFDTSRIRLPAYPFGEQSSETILRERCEQAISDRNLDAPEQEIRERIDHECTVIDRMGFADYFLIVADIVNWARDEGIRVGPGRGSAAGSLVAYLLKITEVDPFEFDLIFERFLNPDRNEMPDIDIDFADHRRDEVIQYIRRRFGEESVAHIVTFGNMKARNALRNVGRIRGEPRERIDRMAELIPPGTSESLKRLRNRVDRLSSAIEGSENMEEWFQQARKLEGFVRNASIHAAGLLIVEGQLRDQVPLYYTDSKGEIPAVQFDMYDVESMGFLKLDVLGLTTLTQIDRTLEVIPESNRPDLTRLPDRDEKTFEFLKQCSLEGIFQFESGGSRELVRNMQPKSRKDIVDCIALYRPGPMEIRDDYLLRREGKQEVNYPHEDLEPILEDTYGLFLYQEQVMAAAREIGGFSWTEADRLRKAMGKKKGEIMADMRDRFVEGAVENGYDREWSKSLFETLAQFAEYGFNRSHSAAYGEITYWTAYLKAHHTPAFYRGLMSVKSGNRDRLARIADAMNQDGVIPLPPDVNRSEADFGLEDGEVRYGLRAIKHVGNGLAGSIEQSREQDGPFDDLEDFVSRIPPGQLTLNAFQALASAGVFDVFEPSRAELVEQAEQILEYGSRRFDEREAGQQNIFGEQQEDRRGVVTNGQTWGERRRRKAEREALGFYLESDDQRYDEPDWIQFTTPGSLHQFLDFLSVESRDFIASPQLVARVDRIIHEQGERYVRVEDEEDQFMLQLRNKTNEVDSGELALANLQWDGEEWLVNSLRTVDSEDAFGLEVHITPSQDLSQLRQLKNIVRNNPGNHPVRFVIHRDGEEDSLVDPGVSVALEQSLHEQLVRLLGSEMTRLYVVEGDQ
ncbi:MAG: DNA polymerase III subunit alpha [bacterium]